MAGFFKVLEEDDANSILRAMGIKQKGNRITEKQKRKKFSCASDILKEWENNGVPKSAWDSLKSDNSCLLLKFDLIPSDTESYNQLTGKVSNFVPKNDFQLQPHYVEFDVTDSADYLNCVGTVKNFLINNVSFSKTF